MPRHWRVGEDYKRGRRVQFRWNDCCVPSSTNSGDVTDAMPRSAWHEVYELRTGIELPDVVELLWVNGGE